MGRSQLAHRVSRKLELVVVAIPSDDDYVWKVSSEKVPHLTLLYLGETDISVEELKHFADYVEHAASLTNRFFLDVKHRGTLGDKKADVLFFSDKWAKEIKDFRAQLLRDDAISKAYHSTEQFPEWTPHLTLGYPETPAHKSDRTIDYVSFDRIALWVGDSVGPTFPLKTYDSEVEVAMYQSPIGAVLQHYGVKGMKWGVRRSDPGAGASADAKAASAAQAKIKSGGTKSLSNAELQGLVNRMNLERQYSTLRDQQKDSINRGNTQIQKVLKAGKTVEDVRRFLDSPTGKAVKRGLKGAVAAAKVAAAFKTGGASAAAGAGAAVAVRRMSNHYTNYPR